MFHLTNEHQRIKHGSSIRRTQLAVRLVRKHVLKMPRSAAVFGTIAGPVP